MIMHELINELKTSLRWAGWCPSCGCAMSIDNHGGGSHLRVERYVKNSPTCCALLNVGFMIVLRRAGWYVLIWARKAVPTNLQLSSFQTSQLLEQNLKNYFSVLVLCQCCPRNDAVKLYGRSHPAPKIIQGWSTLRVMDPMGVKGRRGTRVSARFMASKV